jgi:hypothetical protein
VRSEGEKSKENLSFPWRLLLGAHRGANRFEAQILLSLLAPADAKLTPSRQYRCELTSFSNALIVGWASASRGCRPSPEVQRTSDYQSKVGFPDTLNRSPEVADNRRKPDREPKLYR